MRHLLLRLAFAVLVLLASAACTPSRGPMYVQFIRYPDVAPNEHAPDCDRGTVVEAEARIPESCVQYGDIFLGETGETHPCEPSDLREELSKQVCRRGGSLGQVIRILEPRGGSTCHQLRAALFRCAEGVFYEE